MKPAMIAIVMIFALIALPVIFGGCSGNNAGNPVTAAVTEKGTLAAGNHYTWGLWQFTADPAAGTLDVIPLRAGNFHLNALPFLEPPVLVNLTLESLEFNGNIIDADIGLRHPFLGLTEFTGFDVCGVFIANGSVTGFDDPELCMAGDGDTRLLNPDGYTRWWNPAEFPHGNNMFSYKDGLLGTSDSVVGYNSTLNAYKYYCDDLELNDPLDNVTLAKRGMFSAGKKNVRHYTIDMGAGLIFNYAVDACWEFPTGPAPWMAPDDFAPDANRPEAWRIKVTEVSNSLWNDGSGLGGDLLLSVDVYDWYNAELNTVKVESPGNFAPVTSTTPISGGEGFSTYEIEILDATPAQESISLFISVESEAVGYGDVLPGKPVTAYFDYAAAVSDVSPVTDSIWWQSHMYNLDNIGWNPTATMPDPSALKQQWNAPLVGYKFTTPVVADEKIFFSTNGTYGSYWETSGMTFYCYDLASGDPIWNKLINPTGGTTSWRVFSCPVWWQGPDDIDRIAVGGDQVYCFNADTGEEIWSFDTTYGANNIGWWSNQMQEYNGMVLARSRYETLYVLDFETGTLISTVICSDISEGGCTAKDGKVYINSSHYVDCADISTGTILWSTQLPNSDLMNHWINPVIIGDRIYLTSTNGTVYCLSIADEGGYTAGQIIWFWSDPLKPFGSTAMMAGAGARQSDGVTRLYVASSSAGLTYVYCLEDQGASASLIWRSSQTDSFEGAAVWANAPSYPEGVVYCPGAYSGILYAFDASDGALVWTYSAGPVWTKCGVSIVDDLLVLMSNSDVRVLKAPE